MKLISRLIFPLATASLVTSCMSPGGFQQLQEDWNRPAPIQPYIRPGNQAPTQPQPQTRPLDQTTSPRYQPPAGRNVTQIPAPTPTPTPAPSTSYPVATPGVKDGTVISPYAPYNVIDVTGFKSGQKAADPSTIPNDPATGRPYVDANGNPDVTKAKVFLVP